MINETGQIKQKPKGKHSDFFRCFVHTEVNPEIVIKTESNKAPIGPIDEPKRAKRIVPKLIKYIQSHNLVPGSKLPSQRELCQILRVGTNSLFQLTR